MKNKQFKNVFKAIAVCTGLLFAIIMAFNWSTISALLWLFVGFNIVLLTLEKYVISFLRYYFRKRVYNTRVAIVVGTGREASARISRRPEYYGLARPGQLLFRGSAHDTTAPSRGQGRE